MTTVNCQEKITIRKETFKTEEIGFFLDKFIALTVKYND